MHTQGSKFSALLKDDRHMENSRERGTDLSYNCRSYACFKRYANDIHLPLHVLGKT